MDAARFDTFARSLTNVRSRRGALTALLGGTLGLLGLTGTAAKKGKGKDKKKKKKGGNPSSPPPPPADPTAPPPPTCDPSCPGDQTCRNGTCVCPRGKEPCGGGCVSQCLGGAIRNPVTCGCCLPNGNYCDVGTAPCCGASCYIILGQDGMCPGLGAGQSCAFNERCASGACVNGACT
jgi:hypothetical protein